jgi:hypothetical protein
MEAMLRIREALMEILATSAEANLHQRLLVLVRNVLPAETAQLGDAILLEGIADGVRRAAKYGIESEIGLGQFICLTFAVPAFDELPEARAYLDEPGLDADRRMSNLIEYLSALGRAAVRGETGATGRAPEDAAT